MGRQTRFYVDPGDYAALAAGLLSLGAVLLSRRSPTPEARIADPGDPAVPVNVLVTLPRFLAELRPRYSHHQGAWLFNEQDDPVVELHLWPPREGVLWPGRVYFTTRSLEGDEVDLRFEDKSPEFVAFAERLRRFVRRWCEKRDGLLVSPSLAARYDSGKVVRHGLEGLRLQD
jgi:hypothetical protein